MQDEGRDIQRITAWKSKMNEAKTFSEIFAKNYEKNRREFEESTKGLCEDIPYERKHLLIQQGSHR